MLNYKHSLEQQIEDKQALFDTHHRLEEAEDLKAKLFRDAKDDMKREHQKIKERLDANKNYLRQRVANTLSDKDAKLRAKEQEILEKAVRAAEEKVRENKNPQKNWKRLKPRKTSKSSTSKKWPRNRRNSMTIDWKITRSRAGLPITSTD
ncbi:TPH domain-containing protein [Caerostris extrusa]|uniref:TPH domain-containing protein n=1 Tax=Caerostris extrusa TaxID=172846 RepID=A0AAV4M4F0_CAEEX|nr:TPH domain-containing protein [Caerostris extrusa]